MSQTPPPLINLEEGLYLQVDGEEEKKHTLSWDVLKAIGDSTQNLIIKLAAFSVADIKFDVRDLKLDFVGFFPGSAVPQFKIKDFIQSNMFPVKPLYDELNPDFSFIVAHLDDGNFQAIADRYTEPSVKNEILEAVYQFSNSAGTKPFRVVKPNKTYANGFKPLAKVRQISPTIKKMLTVEPPRLLVANDFEPVEAVSKVFIKVDARGKKTTKYGHLYTQKEASLSLRFDSIEVNNRTYVLRGEVFFSLNEAKKHVSIEHPMLDIFASGEDMKEAENDLFEQFDYTYQRLNQIEDNKLSRHLLTAKQYINLIVERVKEQ